MPQRDILAELLPGRLRLRHLDGRNALAALDPLYEETDFTAYRNSLRPQNGKCLYRKPIAEFILNCRNKLSMKANVPLQIGPWLIEGGCTSTDLIKRFTKSWEWEDHCREHLDHPEALLRCDPLVFRNTPIKAGFCPFCFGNKTLCPSKRMVQFFISPPEWHNHVEAHLSQLDGNFKCGHPACLVDFERMEELTYHLIDTHCWRLRRESPKKRKYKVEETP
ncbi:hypothetical protein N7530_003959 [Penicillium desertorum]|uniref:C2H2-type domain-containing protein n=1 Tax=Penicillium desertorum TaxID=1303715 RepID=A0A9W9WXP8_9EURO|nr:hypothetical protein N7530_003959 [Penicillium desertorum]